MKNPTLAVLYGGVSAEREVSLRSGKAVADAFSKHFEVDLIDVTDFSLPEALSPEKHVVFSTLHGTFGEDGGIHKLMEEAGVSYAGCASESAALTFDKVATKRVVAEVGVSVLDQIEFTQDSVPAVEEVMRTLGGDVVMKPIAQGSSVGLRFGNGEAEITGILKGLDHDRWMLEPRVVGREVTVGVLGGKALEIVEICPKEGGFDYTNKYTKGKTEYHAPAEIGGDLTRFIKDQAETAYSACGCRDYARIDFMISSEGWAFFLEINTLPGMTSTSLLPMSAGACGMNFDVLLKELVKPAFCRYEEKYSVC
ncbi:MAG: D-alanine--D-alanine ligase [Verrucomicrobiota bacterium]